MKEFTYTINSADLKVQLMKIYTDHYFETQTNITVQNKRICSPKAKTESQISDNGVL